MPRLTSFVCSIFSCFPSIESFMNIQPHRTHPNRNGSLQIPKQQHPAVASPDSHQSSAHIMDCSTKTSSSVSPKRRTSKTRKKASDSYWRMRISSLHLLIFDRDIMPKVICYKRRRKLGICRQPSINVGEKEPSCKAGRGEMPS